MRVIRLSQVVLGGLLSGYLLASPAAHAAGIPVVDALANANWVVSLGNQMREYLNQIKQLENEANQIRNQITQIQHAATTVEQGVTNLAQLRFNNLQDILTLYATLDRKLQQARGLGLQVQGAMQEAQRIYPSMNGQVDAAGQRALALQWATTQREAAQTAVRTQAIADTQALAKQEWEKVLTAAKAAQGNLEVQQAGVQALGQLGTQLSEINQQLATSARSQSQRELQEASQVEMEQAANVRSAQDVRTSYVPQGQSLPLPSLK